MNHERHETHERRSAPEAASMLRPFRKALAAFVFFVVAPSLSACGFAPLYGQPGVVAGLAAIQVEAPQGRTGFLMREHLDDAFGKDRGAAPAYHMQLALA